MIIVTTENVPGKKTVAHCGFCTGSTVRAKHIGKDILAGFKTIVGGEIKVYTEVLTEARKIAISRMVEEAEALGANAITALRMTTSNVMDGASEIMAYGTAVKVED
ncbi:MAG: heavy metal-binding domain-containing protein [Oscillospiraceae bacterium]|nr:heavy metal-binding domain-containing protein [Oscillospiraceae bacterium]